MKATTAAGKRKDRKPAQLSEPGAAERIAAPAREKIEPIAVIAERVTGRKPSPATTWRWCTRGVAGGIKLPHVRAFGKPSCTESAFVRWLERCAADGHDSLPGDAVDASNDELLAAGLL